MYVVFITRRIKIMFNYASHSLTTSNKFPVLCVCFYFLLIKFHSINNFPKETHRYRGVAKGILEKGRVRNNAVTSVVPINQYHNLKLLKSCKTNLCY